MSKHWTEVDQTMVYPHNGVVCNYKKKTTPQSNIVFPGDTIKWEGGRCKDTQ